MANQSPLNKISADSRSFLFFFKKIKIALRGKGWGRFVDTDFFAIKFYTRNFSFNYTALKEVKKMYKMLGWDLKLMSYAAEPEAGFKYEFEVTKL